MTAAWIKPPQPYYRATGQPTCEGQIRAIGKHLKYRERHYSEPLRCRRAASCTIDGKHYCSAHGGEIALARLCEGGDERGQEG